MHSRVPMATLRPILLVEDNPKDVELTRAALEASRLANELVVVRDGAEALDYLGRRGEYQDREGPDPAVIVLDIQMPKVSGHEVLAQLRADDTFKRIPVVMLTTSREEANLMSSYEGGANAYVVKPIGFQEFFDAVQKVGAFWAVLNVSPDRP